MYRQFYEEQFKDAEAAHCSERSVRAVVVRMLNDYKGQFHTLLDVGCGANLHYDQGLTGVNVTGVDFTWNLLRLAPKGIAELVQADALKMPFANDSFDAVICSETVEHIEDDKAVIAEIARVLKPDGLLFFTVPNIYNADRLMRMIKTRDFTIHFQLGHLREYTRGMALALLGQYFHIERIYCVPFLWQGIIGTPVDFLIRTGLLARASQSVALVGKLQ